MDDALDPEERRIVEACRPYTLGNTERLLAVVDSVRHAVRTGVEGAFVECGVWRGGAVLAMLLALQRYDVDDRDIYLFDTFDAMTEPTGVDTSRFNESATAEWEKTASANQKMYPYWFTTELFDLAKVQQLLYDTGYPRERLHFVVGKVEDTIPGQAPDDIAILRLDTDWYQSTSHELINLYPRLCPGSVLLIDDYGHWDGARKAVDEYFDDVTPAPLLARTDYTARMAVKPYS